MFPRSGGGAAGKLPARLAAAGGAPARRYTRWRCGRRAGPSGCWRNGARRRYDTLNSERRRYYNVDPSLSFSGRIVLDCLFSRKSTASRRLASRNSRRGMIIVVSLLLTCAWYHPNFFAHRWRLARRFARICGLAVPAKPSQPAIAGVTGSRRTLLHGTCIWCC